MMGNGPNYSMKVGVSTQNAKEVAQNIMKALPTMLAYVTVHEDIPFSAVQQISVHSEDSPQLPVFNQISASELDAYMQHV